MPLKSMCIVSVSAYTSTPAFSLELQWILDLFPEMLVASETFMLWHCVGRFVCTDLCVVTVSIGRFPVVMAKEY